MDNLNRNDHRWTDAEMKRLMILWIEGKELDDIAAELGSTRYALNKMITKMRRDGIPLARRTKGHKAERRNQLWTQAEVEYLIRRRNEKATAEEISVELERSFLAVQGMIQKLRIEGVKVRQLGQGSRRLWNPEALRAAAIGRRLIVVDGKK